MRDRTCYIVLALSIGVLLSGSLLLAQDRVIERMHMAPSHIEELALSLVAERYKLDAGNLKVAGSNKPNFPLTGALAYQVMIIDKRNQEHYSLTLDENGNELDLERLHEDERAAYTARYGRFEPRLAEMLKAAGPDDLIPVLIEPRFPPESPDRPKYPYPDKSVETWNGLPEEEKDRIRKMEEEYERRLDRYLKRRAKQASEPIIRRLAQMGYKAAADEFNGSIRTALKPEIIKEAVEWDDARHVSLDMRSLPRRKAKVD